METVQDMELQFNHNRTEVIIKTTCKELIYFFEKFKIPKKNNGWILKNIDENNINYIKTKLYDDVKNIYGQN